MFSKIKSLFSIKTYVAKVECQLNDGSIRYLNAKFQGNPNNGLIEYLMENLENDVVSFKVIAIRHQ